MNKKSLHLAIAVTVALTLGDVGGASARTVSASSGASNNPFNIGCFSVSFVPAGINGGVTGGGDADPCGAELALWTTPLTLDTFGTKSVRVTSKAVTAGSGDCRIISVSRFGGSFSATAFQPILTNLTSRTHTISVPNNGVLLGECLLGAGATVLAWQYTQ
jgi:hypothetical protein